MGIISQLSFGSKSRETAEAESDPLVLREQDFHTALRLERRRAERSQRPFLLMVAALSDVPEGENHEAFLRDFASALASSGRETDIVGWDRQDIAVGSVFTELGRKEKLTATEKSTTVSALSRRIATIVDQLFGSKTGGQLSLTFHFFPDDPDEEGQTARWMVGERRREGSSRKIARTMKRIIDIGGSSLGLIMFSPVLLAISVLIKLTSKGPVLFRQTRIGRYAQKFTFLKFRSMYFDSDSTIHREYVTHFIAGKAALQQSADHKTSAYKLIEDPRVTPFGRFLRTSSLDELPQLLNVLKGEMSLVGPRPSLPYEFACYGMWHKRRIVDVKPGITGLWQVSGRSTTSFDEMVRLDLRYARSWSLSLDLKILLKTPAAILSGDGAH